MNGETLLMVVTPNCQVLNLKEFRFDVTLIFSRVRKKTIFQKTKYWVRSIDGERESGASRGTMYIHNKYIWSSTDLLSGWIVKVLHYIVRKGWLLLSFIAFILHLCGAYCLGIVEFPGGKERDKGTRKGNQVEIHGISNTAFDCLCLCLPAMQIIFWFTTPWPTFNIY